MKIRIARKLLLLYQNAASKVYFSQTGKVWAEMNINKNEETGGQQGHDYQCIHLANYLLQQSTSNYMKKF